MSFHLSKFVCILFFNRGFVIRKFDVKMAKNDSLFIYYPDIKILG